MSPRTLTTATDGVCQSQARRALRAEQTFEVVMAIPTLHTNIDMCGLGADAPRVPRRTAELFPDQLTSQPWPTLHPIARLDEAMAPSSPHSSSAAIQRRASARNAGPTSP
jgi:hypothetical protein